MADPGGTVDAASASSQRYRPATQDSVALMERRYGPAAKALET
jgi:hypothetical protein